MRAAIIGAGAESIHTINMAKKRGIEILALDGNPKAEGLNEATKSAVIDISKEGAVIDALRDYKPDMLLTGPIGRYLTTMGAANDALGLRGISLEAARRCTDKYLYHITLSESGLRPCSCVRTAEGRDALKSVGYPAILKPRFGSGSRGIHYLENASGLEEALPALGDEDYILEECMPGEEYGVDMAVTEGTAHLILLRKKENTPLPCRQAVSYTSVMREDPFFSEVKNYMTEVVNALGLDNCLMHGDILKTENGPFAIEVSARPSGHSLHDVFTPLCTGIDMADEFIAFQMGEDYSFDPEYTGELMIHFFDLEGNVKNIPDEGDIDRITGGRLVKWNCLLKPGQELRKISDGHSLMGRGYFILDLKGGADGKTLANIIFKNI